jgi:hypothetical protein
MSPARKRNIDGYVWRELALGIMISRRPNSRASIE